MHLLRLVLRILDMHLHRSSKSTSLFRNQRLYYLLLADPCGSVEPSFVDFGQHHFFLYSATMVAVGIILFVNVCVGVKNKFTR